MDGEPLNLEKFRTPEWVVKTLLIALFRRDMGKIIFFFQMDGSTYEKQHLES
jgi:hypothetical protein